MLAQHTFELFHTPAIALAVLADWFGKGKETEAVSELLNIARLCTPNKLLIEIADRILERDGKLITAVDQFV